MTAHYPAERTEDDRAQGFLPKVYITSEGVDIDGTILPGRWIEERGIVIQPDTDMDINRVTITFLVSDIHVADDAINQVRVQ